MTLNTILWILIFLLSAVWAVETFRMNKQAKQAQLELTQLRAQVQQLQVENRMLKQQRS